MMSCWGMVGWWPNLPDKDVEARGERQGVIKHRYSYTYKLIFIEKTIIICLYNIIFLCVFV